VVDAADGCPRDHRTTNIGGGQTVDYQYAYDPNSNRTSQTVDGVTTSYTHNAEDQLTSAGTTTFNYDGNGNETSTSDGRGFSRQAARSSRACSAGRVRMTVSVFAVVPEWPPIQPVFDDLPANDPSRRSIRVSRFDLRSSRVGNAILAVDPAAVEKRLELVIVRTVSGPGARPAPPRTRRRIIPKARTRRPVT